MKTERIIEVFESAIGAKCECELCEAHRAAIEILKNAAAPPVLSRHPVRIEGIEIDFPDGKIVVKRDGVAWVDEKGDLLFKIGA